MLCHDKDKVQGCTDAAFYLYRTKAAQTFGLFSWAPASAQSFGVRPWSSCRRRSPPASSSELRSQGLQEKTAAWMGVLPSLQRLVNISITHEIVCYFHNQTISMDDYGKVWPYWFGFAPYCRSFSATLTKPRRDAQKSGVCPRWFMLSTLTPVEVVIQKALMKHVQSKSKYFEMPLRCI